MFLLLLSFLFASHPDAPRQADPADSVLVLPAITVTATRIPTSELAAPARIATLDREDLHASGARSVADVLAARTAGFIRFYGTGLATLSLRGAAPGHTLLMVDGQRLNDAQTGQIDLSLLPTILLEHVELVHGAGSALYGSDGVAGVINLQTTGSRQRDGYAAEAIAGAFGERGISARIGHSSGPWTFTTAGEINRSAGDYAVPADMARRPDVRRDGADRRLSTLYATARRTGSRHALVASAWLAAAERGLPGPVTTVPIGERQWDEQARFWLSDAVTWSNARLRLSGGFHSSRIRYRNPQLELDETGQTRAFFGEGTLHLSAGRIDLATGLSGDLTRARHPSRRDAYLAHGALFAAAGVRTGRVTWYPALRLDGYEAPSTHAHVALSPRLGVSAPVPRTEAMRMKASAGSVFRTPTLNERYWTPGGNPDLRPERGWHADVGIQYAHRRLALEVSSFMTFLHDEILWLPSRVGHHEALNLRHTRSLGLEASGNASAPLGGRRYLHGGVIVTLTRATDRSDPSRGSFGHQLRYVPLVQAKTHLTLYAGSAALDLNARYVGRRYVTTDGSQWVVPFLVVDAQARLWRTVGSHRLTLTIALENALDAEYAVIQHYPMPPRHLRIALNVSNTP